MPDTSITTAGIAPTSSEPGAERDTLGRASPHGRADRAGRQAQREESAGGASRMAARNLNRLPGSGADLIAHAFLGEAGFRRAAELLLGSLLVAVRLRIFLAFGHEAVERRTGQLLVLRLDRAGISGGGRLRRAGSRKQERYCEAGDRGGAGDAADGLNHR